MKIVCTGGGTGGHILPILAVTREIQKLTQGSSELARLFYVGPKDEFNELLLSQENIVVSTIIAGKIRRYGGIQTLVQNFFDVVFKTPIGIVQAFFKILVLNPNLIFSKGGYGALPITIAGWVLRIPIFLHESDSIPGLANRVSATFSLKVFTSFENTEKLPLRKLVFTGNPVREQILSGSKEEAKTLFQLAGSKPLILVLGGSQGSQKINDVILEIANVMLKEFEVIHQTGTKNYEEVKAEAQATISKDLAPYYHATPFLKEHELRHAYAAADLVVNRAGSGSIFELAALGKPSILIPLSSSAQNHQAQNSYLYANTGAAVVLEEANVTPHFFLEKLKYLFANPQELETMSKAALSFAKPEAAQIIAQYLLEYLKK